MINEDNSRVVVSLAKQRAYLMMGDQVYIDTPISSGKRAGMTATGSFTVQAKDKEMLHEMYLAPSRAEADKAFDLFVRTYEAKYPKATECLAKDRPELLAF